MQTVAERLAGVNGTANGTPAPRTGKGKPAGKGKARRPATRRRVPRRDLVRAGALFGLAGAGLCVSLPHLASEVGLLTGTGAFAAWCLSAVIDLGMCATKAHLSCRGPARNVAWTVLGGCTALSIVLNCHAFLANASTAFGVAAGLGFGAFLPLFVLALSYLGSETLLGRRE